MILETNNHSAKPVITEDIFCEYECPTSFKPRTLRPLLRNLTDRFTGIDILDERKVISAAFVKLPASFSIDHIEVPQNIETKISEIPESSRELFEKYHFCFDNIAEPFSNIGYHMTFKKIKASESFTFSFEKTGIKLNNTFYNNSLDILTICFDPEFKTVNLITDIQDRFRNSYDPAKEDIHKFFCIGSARPLESMMSRSIYYLFGPTELNVKYGSYNKNYYRAVLGFFGFTIMNHF